MEFFQFLQHLSVHTILWILPIFIPFTSRVLHKQIDSFIDVGNRVNVEGFLYSDIYEEGLVERVRIADEELNAYYEEQDRITKELVEQMEAQENE